FAFRLQIEAMRRKSGIHAAAGAAQNSTEIAALRGGAPGDERREDLFLRIMRSARDVEEAARPDDEIVACRAESVCIFDEVEPANLGAIGLPPCLSDQLLDIPGLEDVTCEVLLEALRHE